jgi:hypothetical protein
MNIMSKFYLQFALLLFNIFVYYGSSGQTYISGVIANNTTWNVTNSPYIVTGNTVLLANCTLSIEPGVIVKFDSLVQLDIRGSLIAEGTVFDSIYFIRSGQNNWNGIKLSNPNGSKAILKYCHGSNAEHGFFNIPYSTSLVDTILQLRNCYFEANYCAIDLLDITKSFYSIIDSCRFINSSLSHGASNCIVTNSSFSHGGRSAYNSTTQATIIDNCDFYQNLGPLCVNGIITNSRFYHNRSAISTMINAEIHYNAIYENDIGIEAWNYSVNSTTQITNNRICNNTINIKKIWASDTYVLNNCWCLTDSIQISNTIEDFFDNSSYGIVFYSPYDTTCITPLQINSINNNSYIKAFPTLVVDKIDFVSTIQDELTIHVFDIYSKLLMTEMFSEFTSINVIAFPPGMYTYVVIKDNNFIQSGKFFIQK